MSHDEREKIKEAMRLILSGEQGDWEKGMAILSRLVDPNWQSPLASVRPIGITDLMREVYSRPSSNP